MKKRKKSSWIVTVEAKVMKELICEDCTEEQARSDPYLYSIDEREVDVEDWEVKDVQENI